MEELDFLIDYLLKENLKLNIGERPQTIEEKENLWRTLCNIREAKSISDEYLKIQDEFLQKRLKSKEITDVYDLHTIPNSSFICLWQGDITKLKIDCIVNAANSRGLGCFQPLHNCIDNQIQTYSGVQMRIECDKYMRGIDYNLDTGKAFITKGYNLPAKYVIHTVGPIINYYVSEKDEQLLQDCYKNSLKLAKENNIKTIAFPCISTGVFSFPKDLAVICAFKAVNEFISENQNVIEKIVFNVYGNEDFEVYDEYIKQNLK